MTGWTKFASVALLIALFPVAQNAQNLPKLEAKFQEHKQQQKGAVDQAKDLAKLLPQEVQAAANEIANGDVEGGIARLEHWDNQTQQVHDALLASGRKAVKDANGFRQLEMALRKSTRRLAELVFRLPFGHRQRAMAVQDSLDQIDSQLLQEIFPAPAPPEKGK